MRDEYLIVHMNLAPHQMRKNRKLKTNIEVIARGSLYIIHEIDIDHFSGYIPILDINYIIGQREKRLPQS